MMISKTQWVFYSFFYIPWKNFVNHSYMDPYDYYETNKNLLFRRPSKTGHLLLFDFPLAQDDDTVSLSAKLNNTFLKIVDNL